MISVLGFCTVGLLISTIVLASNRNPGVQPIELVLPDNGGTSAAATAVGADVPSSLAEIQQSLSALTDRVTPLSIKPPAGENPCAGTKPKEGFDNAACFEADVEDQAGADVTAVAREQAGANVTAGYVGNLKTDAVPITVPYFKAGLCPVNVHWHLGTEHYSAGQYDENGSGPSKTERRHRRASGSESVRRGYQCNLYDAKEEKFTKAFDWKHCVGMEVGQTYEVHWPHSKGGACGTINQYQTPFYDGVFCNGGELAPTTYEAIGVQGKLSFFLPMFLFLLFD